MIPYIDKRLQDWARWRIMGTAGVAVTMIQRLMDNQGVMIRSTASQVLHGYEEEMLTDKAVASLLPELRDAIEAGYIRQGGMTQKLSYCRCSKATYFRRMDHAHLRIMDFVNAHDPAEEVKKRLTVCETIL